MQRGVPLFFFLLLSVPLAGASGQRPVGMSELSEVEMGSIDGQQGVVIDLLLRNNVDATNAPIGCTTPATFPATPNPCRFGMELGATVGTWLMFKEFFGTLSIVDLRMDASFLPAADTAYWNSTQTQFKDVTGATCLLPGNPVNCSPIGLPGIKLTYPADVLPLTAATEKNYGDLLTFLNIGRSWLEFDNTPVAATPGYKQDSTGNSVFAVRMSDSSALNASARMRFLGTGYVYGF